MSVFVLFAVLFFATTVICASSTDKEVDQEMQVLKNVLEKAESGAECPDRAIAFIDKLMGRNLKEDVQDKLFMYRTVLETYGHEACNEDCQKSRDHSLYSESQKVFHRFNLQNLMDAFSVTVDSEEIAECFGVELEVVKRFKPFYDDQAFLNE